MPRQSATTMASRYPHIAALLLTVVVGPGCTSTKNWLQGRKTADAEPIVLGAPETDQYINDMYRLVSGDPATQAEIYADSRAAAQLTPDPSTRLRYALVLATPGHSESNPDEAQNLLRDLLSQKELMSPGEISLATISLEQVEDRIMLGAETSRLRTENTRAASTEDAAIAQRIATVEAENRRLRQSLAEAEDKLEAITSIERAIREQ
ncbi:MAG: hypothetical protein RLN69_10265 [Woeseiaceae bacterium]